jgi:hypothetical protein
VAGVLAVCLLESVLLVVFSVLLARGRHSTLPSRVQPPSAAETAKQKPRSEAPAEIIVSATAGGQYATISDAVRDAAPGSRILVRPGAYQERIVLDRPLEIAGDGPRDKIILRHGSGSVLLAKTKSATVRGLTIVRQAGIDNERSFAVEVAQGQVVVEDCDITCKEGTAIGVHGAAAAPVFRRCTVHDSKYSGFFFYEGGRGAVEECEIVGNAIAGVSLDSEADPLLHHCIIRDGKLAGIAFSGDARATVSRCKISGHVTDILAGGASQPALDHCDIHSGRGVGAAIGEAACPTFSDCDIHGSADANVLVKGKASPTFTRCRIFSGKRQGLAAGDRSRGTMQDCEVYGNQEENVLLTGESEWALYGGTIHDGEKNGLALLEKAKGFALKCKISGHTLPDVVTSDEANLLLRACKISASKTTALGCRKKSRLVAEQCEIFDTRQPAVVFDDDSSAVLRHCTVYKGKDAGVVVRSHAEGQLIGCKLFGHVASLAVLGDGPVTVEHCEIHDSQVGALLAENVRAALWDCDLENNGACGVLVRGAEDAVLEDCRFRGDATAVTVTQNSKLTVHRCTVVGAAGEAWTVQAGAKLSGGENIPVLPGGLSPDPAALGAWRQWPFRLP